MALSAQSMKIAQIVELAGVAAFVTGDFERPSLRYWSIFRGRHRGLRSGLQAAAAVECALSQGMDEDWLWVAKVPTLGVPQKMGQPHTARELLRLRRSKSGWDSSLRSE
jgi:hypothetical protein